ncbi:MAG TPA: EAL domain-containing protein [Solimonas sp.]|nr:EAL domain-containing protein [Solimonas sp.]
MGLGVVADGVEKPEQLACLREIGCDEVQGFLLGAPDGRLRTGRSDAEDLGLAAASRPEASRSGSGSVE